MVTLRASAFDSACSSAGLAIRGNTRKPIALNATRTAASQVSARRTRGRAVTAVREGRTSFGMTGKRANSDSVAVPRRGAFFPANAPLPRLTVAKIISLTDTWECSCLGPYNSDPMPIPYEFQHAIGSGALGTWAYYSSGPESHGRPPAGSLDLGRGRGAPTAEPFLPNWSLIADKPGPAWSGPPQ